MTAIRTSAGHELRPVPGKWQATALYALLTILLTFPLSVTADRHLPGAGADDLLFMWTLAWNTHALVTEPLSIFDANIFYPNANSLAYSENLIGSAFFAAPVLWLTGNPRTRRQRGSVALLRPVRAGSLRAGAPGRPERDRRRTGGAHLRVLAATIFPLRPDSSHGGPVDSVCPGLPTRLPGRWKTARPAPRDRLLLASGVVQRARWFFLAFAMTLMFLYRLAVGEAILLGRRLRDFGVLGLCLVAPAALLMIPYRAAQVEVGLRRSLGTWNTPMESFFASPTHVHVFLQSLVTSHDINGVATTWAFPGVLPLGLALIALLGGAAALARAVTLPAWSRPSRLWPRVAPEYRWPIRILAAAAVAWALLPLVRPVFHAGEGLSVERFGDSTVVQTGYITVGEPGSYRFHLAADGSARLMVNNRVVIDRNQLRPDASRTGSVQLSAGSHRVLLQYVLGEGQQAVEWGWHPQAEARGYRSVPWWALSQRPVSHASVIGVRIVNGLLLVFVGNCRTRHGMVCVPVGRQPARGVGRMGRPISRQPHRPVPAANRRLYRACARSPVRVVAVRVLAAWLQLHSRKFPLHGAGRAGYRRPGRHRLR